MCPVHVRIDPKIFISNWRMLRKKHGSEKVGMALHSEVRKELLDFGTKNGAYIGGTGGMTYLLVNSSIPFWIVGTVEPFIRRLRLKTGKEIMSPGVSCVHMEYTTRDKVEKALGILRDHGPVADITICDNLKGHQDISILLPEFVQKTKEATIIPAARLHVAEGIRRRAKENLNETLMKAMASRKRMDEN